VSRRTLVRIAGVAISLACLAYVSVRAARVWDQAGPSLLEADTFVRLGLALIPMTLAYGAAALAWVALLRSFGVHAAPLSTSGAYLAAQVGKYLPGNVGHYVGRVVLGTRVGLPASTVTLAMTVEFGLLIAIAALLGLPMLQFTLARLGAAWHAPPSTQLLVLAACGVVIVMVLLVIARWRPALLHSLKQWAMQLRAPLGSASAVGRLALSLCLSMAVFGLSSCALLLLGELPQDVGFEMLRRVVSLYSVAWIVGALTPGAPGGIGVREAILIEGLTPLWGAGEAVAGALAFRVVTVATDVIALGLGVAAMKGAARGEVSPPSDVARRPLPPATDACALPRAAHDSPPRDPR
jgi:glycosyltransferase 2 family protein